MRPLEGTADAPVQGHSTNVRLVRDSDKASSLAKVRCGGSSPDGAMLRTDDTQR